MDNSLASGNENLIVGDVKQSIYRWRNSDWQLLDKQLFVDFNQGQIHEEYLSDNWRSSRNVIDFNNLFFSRASIFLQQLFNDDLPGEESGNRQTDESHHKMQDAYKGLFQHYSPKATEGHVEVRFVDNEEKNWKEEALAQLPLYIEQWQDKGFALRDMAVLVRFNKEATEIVEYLLNYKNSELAKPGYRYDVISNEALIIGNSQSVKFIVQALRYILQPDDRLLQSMVTYLYYLLHAHLSPQEALSQCFSSNNKSNPEQIRKELEQIVREGTNRSIFELSEELIHLFNLGANEGEDVFLQAFQDLVHQYSLKESAGIASFLRWWDDKGASKAIATPDAQNAVRVITVHKSKGLGFEVVIIPFADWTLDNRNRDILWCEPSEAPFNALELTPVHYSKSLADTIFANDYFEEKMASFIDNLNVAYVAFTRAKQELILIAPQPKPNAKKEIPVTSLSTLLHHCIANEIPVEEYPTDCRCASFSPFWDEVSVALKMGESAQQKENQEIDNQVQYQYAESICPVSPIAVKYKGVDFLETNTSPRKASINYGVLMHEVLRNIRHAGDESRVVADMERSGHITEDEKANVNRMLENFWAISETKNWFAPHVKTLNETPIFTPEGNTYIPDRVVIENGKATIIDYKFGQEKPKYRRQVLNYKQLVEEMGYSVSAFLCYVEQNRVEEVM